MKVWGWLCGWTLARGHARSGDCIAIAAYLGQSDSFDCAMVSFAETYADQNERDYAAFQKAVKDKRNRSSGWDLTGEYRLKELIGARDLNPGLTVPISRVSGPEIGETIDFWFESSVNRPRRIVIQR